MPMHDWTKVPAGIYHAFHSHWIYTISDVLNAGLLPGAYYALPEQMARGPGPDILTLRVGPEGEGQGSGAEAGGGTATATRLERPETRFMARTEAEFYRQKKNSIVVRHVSGDQMIAVIEILSPGNTSGRKAFEALLDRIFLLVESRIHLLLIDPLPPGPRDPDGIHGAVWDAIAGEPFRLPPEAPLTLAAYECENETSAYVETVAVGAPLPDMPLFLERGSYVKVPLEATYQAAFHAQPRRWRDVLEPPCAP